MEHFDLQAIQLLVESQNSIEKTRETLTEAVSFFSSQPNNEEKVRIIFRDLRHNLDLSSIDEKDIFLYDTDEFSFLDIPDEFKAYSVGLYNVDKVCRYNNRLVYPVRDTKGMVMGLCGWDPIDEPKYLDSKTYGYSAKNNSMYGMEKLYDYYKSNKPVFVTEGIVCCNYLRSKGFNSLALLGSYMSGYVIEILKRFKERCVLIPDNDLAGLSVVKTVRYKLPMARCYISTIAKDIDDTRRLENGKYELELLSELKILSTPFVQTRILRTER